MSDSCEANKRLANRSSLAAPKRFANKRSSSTSLGLIRALLLIVLLPLLAACDPIYGVTRRAPVQFMPKPASIRAVVQHTPGVDEVRYTATEGGKPLTLSGVQSASVVHTFFYRGGSRVRGSEGSCSSKSITATGSSILKL